MRYNRPPAITNEGNRITVKELRHPRDVSTFYTTVRKLTQEQGYSDVFIDFSGRGRVFPNAATPVCAAIQYYKSIGVNVVVEQETDFFELTHVCNPLDLQSAVRQDSYTPLNKIWKFQHPEEVHKLTSDFSEALFTGLVCGKGVVESFEWCVNEIMDNVLQHSKSEFGYIMGQVHKGNNKVAFCIADSGVGLCESLQSYSPPPMNSVDAITLSIKEGVTRDKNIGQGNGLWGLASIVSDNEGMLRITSGEGSLFCLKKDEVKVFSKLPMLAKRNPGTVVDFQLNTETSINISKALKCDHFSLRMESFENDTGSFNVIVSEHSHGTGTRKSAEKLRNKILNILNETSGTVVLDFSKIGIISSSFADECIAKLLVELGFFRFNQLVQMKHMNETVGGIIEKAINQRMGQSYS